jgi:hypothetical protein
MYKGKGIIFVGCSFTWGGGLEYYAPFKDIPNPYACGFDESKISFALNTLTNQQNALNVQKCC